MLAENITSESMIESQAQSIAVPRRNYKFYNFKQATHLSVLFFLVYIPCNLVQEMQSEVLSKQFGNQGFIDLSLVYLVSTLMAFFAPAITKLIGIRTALTASSLIFAFGICTFILPSIYDQCLAQTDICQWPRLFFSKSTVRCFMIGTSMLSGVSCALLWVCQGEYVALCATKEHKGFYFGYFWVWYMSSQIIGNLFGAASITHESPVQFFLSLGLPLVGVSFLFCCLQNPRPFPV